MQFLTESKIEFMKYRKVLVWVSATLLVVAFAEIFFMTGINLGIDFAGGTQLTVRMRDAVPVDDLRRTFESAGLRDASIQQYGPVESQEVLIKAPVVEESEEGSSKLLIQALDDDLNSDRSESQIDLNQRGREVLATALTLADPDERKLVDDDQGQGHYDTVATAVIEQRNNLGLFSSWEQVQAVEGLSDGAFQTLQGQGFLGAFHVIQNENVGPQIGSELRTKGILAVVLSFLGMLMYIWYRFELRFGVGAIVAVVHDFMITLGLYALFDYEFNLPTIAAFLTLVGYSVNDTVVIFDRVRENRRRYRRKDLESVINVSINQTLSRTILTSGTTLLVVGCLYFLGGEVLKGFAFVLLIGVIVGTYSSIYVASPFTLLWEHYFGQKAKAGGGAAAKAQTV